MKLDEIKQCEDLRTEIDILKKDLEQAAIARRKTVAPDAQAAFKTYMTSQGFEIKPNGTSLTAKYQNLSVTMSSHDPDKVIEIAHAIFVIKSSRNDKDVYRIVASPNVESPRKPAEGPKSNQIEALTKLRDALKQAITNIKSVPYKFRCYHGKPNGGSLEGQSKDKFQEALDDVFNEFNLLPQ